MRSSSDSLNARKVILKPRIVSLAVRVRAAAWLLLKSRRTQDLFIKSYTMHIASLSPLPPQRAEHVYLRKEQSTYASLTPSYGSNNY